MPRVRGDRTAPQLQQTTPADNSTDVAVNANLILTFNEAVKAGLGNIEIRNAANGSLVQSIAVTDTSKVTFAGNHLTINPGSNLSPDTSYYVTFASGVVRDLANNAFAGIASPTTFNFTTELVPDTTAPVFLGATPSDNSTDVPINSNIVLTFNEPIAAGYGKIWIFETYNGLFREIPISDAAQIQISGNTVTINPNVNLLPGTLYNIIVGPDAVRDLSGNSYAGYQEPTLLNFTTASSGGDITKPQFVSATPALDTTDVSVATNITVTFDEAVQAGYGKLLLGGPDGLAQTIDVRDTSQVTFSGNTMTINPSVNLNPGWWYSLEFPTFGVVTDLAGNGFGGLAGRPDIWFTTQDGPDLSPPTLAWSVPADDGTGVNPLASISLVFSEAIKAGSGSIQIRKSADGSLVESIPVTDPRVSIYGKSLTIDPNMLFALGTSYYVTFSSGLVRDLANNNVGGISSPTALNFTIQHPTAAPDLVSITPGDNAANVAVGSNFVLTFDENVVAGIGDIEIYRINGGLAVSLSASDTSQVTFSGNTVTLNPSINLQPGNEYYMWFSSGIVKDAQGNSFGGIEHGAFNFTTAGTSGGVTGLTGNAARNTIVGGPSIDVITGLGSGDMLTGHGSADVFVYTAVSDSQSRSYDTITDFNASEDYIAVWFQVTGVDTAITSGSLAARRFDANLASEVGAGKLASHHAVLFTPSSGSEAGKTYLIIDVNGTAGYQANADLVILLGSASSLGGLTVSDFTT